MESIFHILLQEHEYSMLAMNPSFWVIDEIIFWAFIQILEDSFFWGQNNLCFFHQTPPK